MRNLGALGHGNYVEALAVNESGFVVGSSQTPIGSRAFLWTEDAGMQDLNTLLPTGTGIALIAAVDVAKDGRILALGVLDPNLRATNHHTEGDDTHHAGATHLFLLTLKSTEQKH